MPNLKRMVEQKKNLFDASHRAHWTSHQDKNSSGRKSWRSTSAVSSARSSSAA